MQTAIIIVVALTIFLFSIAIFAIVSMAIENNKYIKECEAMPIYRIRPWINGNFSIEKKRVIRWPKYFCHYVPFNWYSTKEDAEADIVHLTSGA